ncbi:ATP-binding protein [Halomonas chromatireducens]|uniref:histidine kinase n=1 Tax=Halomonas chromatireducens TaxID=507626 RepID=A0A0X8HD14_9GAMM|nr:ATP-binding protein [Halomonas chromatireducens]AMD00405.1 Sensor histidine kinase YycG [Halomonas chromatireducens]
MPRPANPQDEHLRLAALYELGILDTPPDPGFDRLTSLACDLFQVPIAVVSLVDARRQWFKSRSGLERCETHRDISFCAHAVVSDTALVVEDAREDARFHDNPFVIGPPHIRFYAGQLLRPDGRHAVGTLCLMDHLPRTLSAKDHDRLDQLAAQVEELLREHQLRVQLVEQKRVLTNTTQRLSALLQAIPDALYLLDETGLVTRLDVATPANEPFADELRRRFALHGKDNMPSFIWQDDGEDTVHEVRVVPAHGEYLAIARDITERLQIEKMKGEFIATVSHELRTPLTAIRGALDMLDNGLAGELPESARPLVSIANKNSRRLVRLINDILDIEKLAAGQLKLHEQRFTLRPLIEQALEDNALYAESFGVALSLVPPAANGEVLLDPDRFAQVMANLLSNASKHSPAGDTVSVSLMHLRRGGKDWLEITVSDRGEGIPLAFQPRVFERFAQADGSDRRRVGGSGLGLAITRSLVHAMGGDIDFTSVPGEGTCFRVRLPCLAPIYDDVDQEAI